MDTAPKQRRTCVLVVGSDPAIRAACVGWEHDHLVFCTEDLLDGLSYAQSVLLDVVVVQYEFAAHSGPLILAAAHKISPTAHLVITSSSEEAAAQSLVSSGVADVFVSMKELGSTLERVGRNSGKRHP